jgi:hypothetical protein
MLQLVNVKQDAAQTLAPQPTPEHQARTAALRLEALEQRLAPAFDAFLKIK